MKNRFLFYLDWRNQMEMMNDEQVRRFVNNLCNYTEGKEVELHTELEKALWIGILPSLKINDLKYEKMVERNKENGKLGGAPIGNQNARKSETTQNNPLVEVELVKTTQNNPNNPISDKREMISDNREMINEKREVVNENGEMLKENWQASNCESKSELIEINTEAPDENSSSTFDSEQSNQGPISITEYRDIMKDFFYDYPNWEPDLMRLGLEEFIRRTQNYHWNKEEYVGMLREFYEL